MKQIVTYVAKDGTRFEDEYEALNYELISELKRVLSADPSHLVRADEAERIALAIRNNFSDVHAILSSVASNPCSRHLGREYVDRLDPGVDG